MWQKTNIPKYVDNKGGKQNEKRAKKERGKRKSVVSVVSKRYDSKVAIEDIECFLRSEKLK